MGTLQGRQLCQNSFCLSIKGSASGEFFPFRVFLFSEGLVCKYETKQEIIKVDSLVKKKKKKKIAENLPSVPIHLIKADK